MVKPARRSDSASFEGRKPGSKRRLRGSKILFALVVTIPPCRFSEKRRRIRRFRRRKGSSPRGKTLDCSDLSLVVLPNGASEVPEYEIGTFMQTEPAFGKQAGKQKSARDRPRAPSKPGRGRSPVADATGWATIPLVEDSKSRRRSLKQRRSTSSERRRPSELDGRTLVFRWNHRSQGSKTSHMHTRGPCGGGGPPPPRLRSSSEEAGENVIRKAGPLLAALALMWVGSEIGTSRHWLAYVFLLGPAVVAAAFFVVARAQEKRKGGHDEKRRIGF